LDEEARDLGPIGGPLVARPQLPIGVELHAFFV
jgi:hypothetical protein